MKKYILPLILIYFCLLNKPAHAENILNINIIGNERISEKTIKLFSNISENEKITDFKKNQIIRDLYETNFFDTVSVNVKNNTLIINVKEFPIIDNILLDGVKAKKYIKAIEKNFKFKKRDSYNEIFLSDEVNSIKSILKDFGFYFAMVTPYVETKENNTVDIIYKINLGNRAKISKISFIGDKVFKDRKLRNVLISEESKFWKFLSNKKFLNEEIINMDKRLLRNFYLNKGYYNIQINSSFAKLTNNEDFELIYNISANEKIYFGDLNLDLPIDFNEKNYKKLKETLYDLKGKPYSILSIEKILDEIDIITLNDEYQSINAEVLENINSNILDINFQIRQTDRVTVERINILGNNVTRENVIRNYLEINEGDTFNEILLNKSENNLQSLNFFKDIKTNVSDGKDKNSKIVNLSVVEKPTGEISAGAGLGTSGGTLAFSVKENNYLGQGLSLDANASVSAESFKGKFSVTNPKYNNTDKSVFFNIQALEIDKLKKSGFKTNKTGFEIGTDFEQYKDFNFGISTRSFYEKIETNSNASVRQKKQTGDYWDTFLKFDFFLDKRNQKFRTTDGFYSRYSIDTPIISENNTLTNSYDFKVFSELFNENVSSMSLTLKSAHSITGDDVKLTERLNVPSKKLRGFESGKVGPKDGNDFIGGNFITALNFNTTVPQLFPNQQNLDALIFIDTANVWGVDYDSSLNDSSKLRSSIGLAVDWYTFLGPLSFSLAEVISKTDSDIEETFRFNIGTSF
ncbi:outer membrane protein assembly factor BamA [Candidatus Pelagibacter sp. HIMB1521]|uniref:outer membrane protein assembly factor BamA n=1 Tax=Candidatus Pelagibacter sp. HIMB1521 TaxID=3413344 RepID=UPI003F838AEA